jgi:hypothetical protein
MAKKTREPARFEIVKPMPFSEAAPKAEPAPRPKPDIVSGQDLLNVMKASGGAWDERLSGLIRPPETLYKRNVDGMTQYSSNGRFEIVDVLAGLPFGKISGSLTDFGAAFYSTQGSVYFVFADMERKVVVKERVFCIHENPPEKGWSEIADRLADAISYSEQAKKKGIVVSDGGLKVI